MSHGADGATSHGPALDDADPLMLAIGAGGWGLVSLIVAGEIHLGVQHTCAAVACLVLAVMVWLLLTGRFSRFRSARVALVACFVAVVTCTASATWRVSPLLSDPLVNTSSAHALIDAEIVINSVPELRSGRVSGPRRLDDSWRCRATIVRWSHIGLTPYVANLPIELDLRRTTHDMVPGAVVHVRGRVGPADPLRGLGVRLSAASIVMMRQAPAWQLLAASFRHSVARSVEAKPPDVRGLLPGLVVGQTNQMPEDLLTAMRDSGLSHVAAVSGGNISIVLIMWLAVLRGVGVGRGRVQLLALAIGVVAYVVVVQPQPSVDRAALMSLAALGAQALGWRLRPLGVLACTVCVLVLVDPFLAVSPGFAMSVLATGALCIVANLRPRFQGGSLLRRILVGAVAAGVCAIAATIVVAPVSVIFGNGVQVGGIVANVLAEPAVFPATISGLLAGVVGWVSPTVANLVVLPGCWATAWIAAVARWVAQNMPATPWAGGLAGSALILVLVGAGATAFAIAPTPRVRRVCAGVMGVGLLLCLGVPAPKATPVGISSSWPPSGWQIIMCDVGQGDSMLLRIDESSAIAVDTGPDPTAESRCLQRTGISRVPMVVLTHFHADHVEGLPGLLAVAHPALIEESPLGEPGSEAHRVHVWAHDAGVRERGAAPGDVFGVGPVSMKVIWPQRILRGVGSDPNNASVTLVAQVAGIRVLLGGDLETAAQEAVLASGLIGRVDVVKVPHHGSAKQSPAWALVSRPRIALIGVGLHNDYGHPWPGTVDAYRRIGAIVGRTDLDGDLAVVRTTAGDLQLMHHPSWG